MLAPVGFYVVGLSFVSVPPWCPNVFSFASSLRLGDTSCATRAHDTDERTTYEVLCPKTDFRYTKIFRRTACARRARDVHRRAHDVRISQFGTRFWPTIFIDVVICVVCGSGNQAPINVFTCSLLAVYPYPLGPVMRRARPVRATCTRHAQTCTPSTRR
jgi:hypothetical protein